MYRISPVVATESRTHEVADCELYTEERDVLEMREANEGAMKSFDARVRNEKTMAILGERWWPQPAKQDGEHSCVLF